MNTVYVAELAQEYNGDKRAGETWGDWRKRRVIALYAAGTPDECVHCEEVIRAIPDVSRALDTDSYGMESV